MKKLHYFAASTDSGCLLGCEHEHQTVTSATACISTAGGYVVGVENDKYRALNDAEEAEFQRAMYGSEAVEAKPKAQTLLIQVSAFIRIQVEPKS
jgi:hypothetical protein